jgi:hypothetical protein
MLSWLEKHLLPCAYKSLFGFDCPACGFQRSFLQLMKGNFAESFALYPPLLFVLVMFLFFAIHVVNKNILGKRLVSGYAWTVLGIVMLSYVIKMIFLQGAHIS